MHVKAVPAKIKTAGQGGDDLPAGEFTALVSVFGSVDSVGDMVMPGAFSKSLAKYAEDGASLPTVWSHDWNNPFSHIGYHTRAEETERGLEVHGKLDIEDNPTARQVYNLLKGGRVRDFSFAYDILDFAITEKDGQEVWELRELDIFEAGPTLIGAHRGTELLSIKSGGAHSLADLLKAAHDIAEQARDRDYTAAERTRLAALMGKADACARRLKDTRQVTDTVTTDLKEVIAAVTAEVKAGRVLSAKNESKIEQIAELAQELLSSVRSDEGSQDDGKATPPPPSTDEDPKGKSDDASATDGIASARLRNDLEISLREWDLAVS